MRSILSLVIMLGCSAKASASDPYRPAFSLEEIVATCNWGQFVLSPDGTRAAFTGVGRYFGHPLFPQFGEDNNLRAVSTATGESIQLTSGDSPKTYARFSPQGDRVAYESEGDIWSVDLKSGAVRRLTTHVAQDRSAAWSPDGKSIAFLSNRWGRWDLYVMSEKGERQEIRQVTSDEFREETPQWSRDGKFIFYASAQDEHFYSRGIYRVPASGGPVARVTPKDNARNNWPVPSPDGRRVAYISDRSGYLNIWTMNVEGEDHRQLTRVSQDQDYPENDYIQSMGLQWSPDGSRILHFTNRLGNLDLVVVSAATGAMEVVDGKDGEHHPVGWVDDRTVAYVYEDYRTPPDLYVKPLGGPARQLTFSSHALYRPENFDRLELVDWKSEDGEVVHGYLRRPSNYRAGDRLPGIVMSHTYNVGQFYNQWNPIFSYIVQSGFVMLMVDHRGSNGYGVRFRDLPKGNWGFAQLMDIASGAGYLRSRPEVDAEHVGMMGYSMGGYLTLLALTTRPDLFRAGISVFGLSEITGDPSRSSPNYIWHLGGNEAQIPEAYRKASPVTYAEKVRGPILWIHSDGDPIEPVTKVRNFEQAMEKAGKNLELKIYTNEAHGLRLLQHQLDSFEIVMRFLDHYFKH